MSNPSKIIFLMTAAVLVLLSQQAEIYTAIAGYFLAAFYAFVSLLAWIQESRSK